ncbi:hypothetical protein B0A52_08142 [Exophiala mesophila]|uniref:Ig-like domain-containing protein n=1 Tax=Exophiala mesophila TaxID=212818 RepID=A0A438MXE0_EXOME|nr:hypothetical protein B0A52_08142 [Exophiala mesophila]
MALSLLFKTSSLFISVPSATLYSIKLPPVRNCEYTKVVTMSSPADSQRRSTPPSSTGSTTADYFSNASTSFNERSPGAQKKSEQATDLLITTLKRRSDSLTLCLFSGLVEASDNISTPQKRELTWINVDPGQ